VLYINLFLFSEKSIKIFRFLKIFLNNTL